MSSFYLVPPTIPFLDCSHVHLFQGNVGLDVALILILPFFLALASAAGIGGGGVIVPLLLIVSKFPSYYSIPLSVTTIVGVSIIAFFMLINLKHPDPNAHGRPLIAFDVAILLLPGALAGTVLGVLLNAISPSWLVLAIIFVVLSYSAFGTVKKGLELYKKENQAIAYNKLQLLSNIDT